MNWQEVRQKLLLLLSLSEAAQKHDAAVGAVTGALAGGVPTRAPIQTESEANAASVSELDAWATDWSDWLQTTYGEA